MAIVVWFVGILVIPRPGFGVFNVKSLIPILAAAMFALHSLLTCHAGRGESAATSFFWMGMVRAFGAAAIGFWFRELVTPAD